MMAQKRDQETTRGKLIIISGPSGVGKSTITGQLIKRLDDAYLSVSVTTRPQAATEQDGREYRFVSREQFHKRIAEARFWNTPKFSGTSTARPGTRPTRR